MPTLTITTTTAQSDRVSAAYGVKLGLGRNANAAEVKAAIIAEIRAVVLSHEDNVARALITSAVFDPT